MKKRLNLAALAGGVAVCLAAAALLCMLPRPVDSSEASSDGYAVHLPTLLIVPEGQYSGSIEAYYHGPAD